ncbi:PD40 domain-containing protein [Catenulispora sp. NF23]|uniref:PD40 domain-containing protein n=1 Tax=Catenulispora pinistramenti TaxID=2705254 RepID=A0ABS5KTN0_9ACTN|nr:PD40 domain-containing protein [Catenulispora pinistramenti]MBS2539870.1 PD40 domain-containing protein [Catenulispora pinistramenti]MBS2549412.1 PD40 domain-containing protein [Catenulispora pinistramenti]
MAEAGAELPRDNRAKILISSIAVLLVVAVAAGVTAFLGRSTKRAGISGGFTVAAGQLTYRSMVQGPDFGKVVELPTGAASNAVPMVSSVQCERSYTASGVLLCLQSEGNLISQPYAEVYNSSFKQIKKLAITGTPNRARLSADGRMAAWTTFVTGDSYTQPGASTRASILDLKTGAYVDSLENFNSYVDGKLYKAVDINIWGVTFTADDNTFYATMGSNGNTWLMKGDFKAQTLTSLRENVECPSLSPDGTRLVFKKRVSDDIRHPWRFTVLNLATMQETPLAETRSVDDQAAWLDDNTVMYAVPHDDDPGSDLYAVPADGTGVPRLLAPNGMSPSVTSG